MHDIMKQELYTEVAMVRYGYCCINVSLRKSEGITTNRSIKKKTFLTKGLDHVSRITESNTASLAKIVEWNNHHGIKVFRVTSCLAPWASEYQWEQLPGFNKILDNLQRVGRLAKEGGQRLSMHPGPFNCLVSSNERVIKNSMADLQVHADLMDMMDLPRDHNAPINIHLGGAYGNPERAANVWCQNYLRLPHHVRSRLTVENDDRPNLFSVKMLYELAHKRVGVPIVFDSHHFECGPQDTSYHEALEMAVSSWRSDVRPICHHSNSAKVYEGEKGSITAHSKFYYKPFVSHDKNVDVELECKSKEIGLFDYRQKFEGLQIPNDILPLFGDIYSGEDEDD